MPPGAAVAPGQGGVGGGGVGSTRMQPENSEVLSLGLVAVAVMTCPAGTADPKETLKLTSPLTSVVTIVEPRKLWPSPLPEGSQSTLEKNSMVKVVLARLSRSPPIVVKAAPLVAKVSVGKFCGKWVSFGSFGDTTPWLRRSIPRPVLVWMELDEIRLALLL